MANDLESLLAVQADDLAIHEVEERLAALQPRLQALDKKRGRILGDIERAATLVAGEEKKQAYLRDKIAEHRALIERNQASMDAVKTMRQATAAVSQMEEAKRIVAEEEGELAALNRRLEDARAARSTHEAALATCEAEQAEARTAVASEQAALEGELAAVRAQRATKAAAVDKALLTKYDRIRNKKRVQAAWPMSGMACGACDTAIPMQRRNQMTSGGMIDVCEGCGVLMYWAGN